MASTYTFSNLAGTTDTAGITPISTPIGGGSLCNAAVTVATQGTDVFGVAANVWLTAIWIPYNCTVTNISFLIGSVGGTDSAILALFNSAGTPVANTALAGTTVGTAATTQTIALTAPYAAKGPGLFYVGLYTNGTTAKLRTVPTNLSNGLWCGLVAGQSFGTVAAVTPPTTFTTAQGPYVFLT